MGHLHNFSETSRSLSTFVKASVDTLFALIPILPDVAFCEGGNVILNLFQDQDLLN
jgi:hypothetical protein